MQFSGPIRRDWWIVATAVFFAVVTLVGGAIVVMGR